MKFFRKLLSAALLVQLSTGKAFSLTMPQTRLGSSPYRADVVIENNNVSKHHATIIRMDGKYFLMDAASANGTYLSSKKLTAEEPVELALPALFRLHDESFLLVSGSAAQQAIHQESPALLLNENMTALKVLDKEKLSLNRYHTWEDGTLNDKAVHREAHAFIRATENGHELVDESPNGGNGTFLNEKRLKPGEAIQLKSGDIIRLGHTKLNYVPITF